MLDMQTTNGDGKIVEKNSEIMHRTRRTKGNTIEKINKSGNVAENIL